MIQMHCELFSTGLRPAYHRLIQELTRSLTQRFPEMVRVEERRVDGTYGAIVLVTKSASDYIKDEIRSVIRMHSFELQSEKL